MYCNLILLHLTVIQVLAAPPVNVVPCENKESSVIPIVSQSEEYDANGAYRFSYETGNGIKREEAAFDKVLPKHKKHSARHHTSDEGGEDSSSNSDESDEIHVQRGSYSYTAPDGTLITVNYIADENGFRPTIVQHSKKSGDTEVTSTINEKSGRHLHAPDSAEIASAPAASISNSVADSPIPKIEARNFESPPAAVAINSDDISQQPQTSPSNILPQSTPSPTAPASTSVQPLSTEKTSTIVSEKGEDVPVTAAREDPVSMKTTPAVVISPSVSASTVPSTPEILSSSEDSDITSTESNSSAKELSATGAIDEQSSTLSAAPQESSATSTSSALPTEESSSTIPSPKITPEESATTGTTAVVTTEKDSVTESSPTTASEDIYSTGLLSTPSLESTSSLTNLEETTELHSTTVADKSSSSTTTSEEPSTIGVPSTTTVEESSTSGIPSTTPSEEPSTSTKVSEESSTTEVSSTTGASTTEESSTTRESETTPTTASDDSSTTTAASTIEAEVTSTTEINSTTASEEISTIGVPSSAESETPTTSQDVPTTEVSKTTSK